MTNELNRYIQTIHSKTVEYTFFSNVCGTLSKIDHMLINKTILNKFKKIKIILNIFTDHSGMKLEINYKKKNGKIPNMWRLNHMLLNSQCVNKKIKEEIKITSRQMKIETQHYKIYEM